MLIPPNSPAPQDHPCTSIDRRLARAREVIRLGLTARGDYQCAAAPPETFASISPNLVAEVAQKQAIANATIQAGGLAPILGQLDTVSAPSDVPEVVPLNSTPDMTAAKNPQAMAARRRNRSSSFVYRSPGVPWGGAVSQSAGSCGGVSFDWFKRNPVLSLFLLAGAGVIVYSAVNE